MSATLTFAPSLAEAFETAAAMHSSCRAVVIVPARNEEASLAATLDALRLQVEIDGRPFPADAYEVLVLLNNCTDRSAAVAQRYAADHPEFRLQVFECVLAADEAHVGTARRALMDKACARLEALQTFSDEGRCCAILSTDADTQVAPDWIACNLAAIEDGAEVVGGVIHLFAEDLVHLDEGTRAAYEQDRALQGLVARLEALLDPDPADPWPRHMEHFGASLACTPEAYRRSGGLPAVKPLEDVAFIDALRKIGARIRHAPDVHIYTSARLDGRAEVGLSGQLRIWREERERGLPHMVESAEWLVHRFGTMARLRRMNESGLEDDLGDFPEPWEARLIEASAAGLSTPRFLEAVDCDGLIEEMFARLPGEPRRHAAIEEVLKTLEAEISRLEGAPEHRV